MGGPAFRITNSWKAAALTMLLLPLTVLDVSLARAEQQILEISVSAFLTDPPEILRENPKGGPELMVEVRDLALSDPTTLKPILTLLPEANKVQKIAIGAGLAQAAKIAANTRPAYSKEIQQAVVQTNEGELILAYDAALATGVGAGHDGILLPEANGALPGTTATLPTLTVGPTATIAPPEVIVPPPEVVVPPPPGVSMPAAVPPPVPPTASVLAVPSPVVPSPIVPSPVVPPAVAQLTETIEPTIPVVPTAIAPVLPAAVSIPTVVTPLSLSVEPQTSSIGESVSPSR